MKHSGNEGVDRRFVIRWSLIILAMTAVLGFGVLNRRLGLERVPGAGEAMPDTASRADTLDTGGDTPLVPVFTVPETGEAEEYRGPEADWPLTACSIFVADGGGMEKVLLDSFPEAPDRESMGYELHLLVLEWCRRNGFSEEDLSRVYVFSSADTLFLDLPRITGVEALKATIEGRFVCFTRLFLLVAGRQSEAYPDGVPVRGVPAGP